MIQEPTYKILSNSLTKPFGAIFAERDLYYIVKFTRAEFNNNFTHLLHVVFFCIQ